MPTRNVNLTDELDRFVLSKVESGQYEDASEVVRAAIDAGDASGIADDKVFERIREKLRVPSAER